MPDFSGDSGDGGGSYVSPDSWTDWGGDFGSNIYGGDSAGASQPGFANEWDEDNLRNLGYAGPISEQYSLGGSGADGQGTRTSQQLIDWFNSSGNKVQDMAGPEATGKYYSRIVGADGKQKGGLHSWDTDVNNDWLQALLTVGAAAGGGYAAGGLASGAGAAAGAASDVGSLGAAGATAGASVGGTLPAWAVGAATGAGSGFAGQAAQSGDFESSLKAGALGGVTGAVGGAVNSYNPAGMLGVTDPTYSNVLNKAVSGGITSGLKGGNPLMGAASAGAGAGANSMWDNFMGGFGGGSGSQLPETDSWNFGAGFDGGFNGGGVSTPAADWSSPDAGGSDYEKWRNANQGYSSPAGVAPMAMTPVLGNTPSLADSFSGQPQQRSQAQSFSPMDAAAASDQGGGSYGSPAMASAATGGWQDYLRKNGGNLAGMLGSLYLGQRQANQAGRTRSMLDSLYSPGGAYATQMRNNITRADAAAGRRSQVAPREVQLAAALTNARSAQLASPGYQGLQGQQQAGMAQMLGPLIAGYNRGSFNGLGDAVSSGYGALTNYFNG